MAEDNDILVGKIRGILYADTLIDLTHVRIEVVDGKVKIYGTVPSLAALNAAENDVLSVDGVKSIENLLEIVYPGCPDDVADKNLEKQLLEAFKSDTSINCKAVKVNVQNGVVTLTGSVDTDSSKESLQSIIKNITSPVIIIDKLAVVTSNLQTDRTIADQIQSVLTSIDPSNNSALVVHIDNGSVILDGKVRDWNEYNRIEFAIRQIPGVAHVKNELILV
jgi:osmotically-inducible protein OsmY